MFDLIIKNGFVIDGTGADGKVCDLGITNDRIAAIGDLSNESAKEVIDATGKCVTPGFIDPHTHTDLSALFLPTFECYLQQGVTTTVGGNCGHNYAPVDDTLYRSAMIDTKVVFEVAPEYFNNVTLLLPKDKAVVALKNQYGIDMDWHSLSEYIDKVNNAGISGNIATLAGYSAIRGAVMGMDCCRSATEEELDKLEALTEQCLKDGAFGLSTGMDPQYIPGPFASDEEIIRMLKVVKKYDGMFASHTFNFDMKTGVGDRMAGYKQMLQQALAAGVRSNVSHVHTLGMGADGESNAKAALDTLAYFEEMAAKGLDLTYDVIPSPYSMNVTIPYFANFLRPFVLLSGNRFEFAKHLQVPDVRKMVRTLVEAGSLPTLDDNKLMSSVYPILVVSKHKTCKEAIGKSLLVWAQECGKKPLDATLDLFVEDPDMSCDMAIPDAVKSNEILCRHPMAMPCADGFSGCKDTNIGLNEDLAMLPNPMNLSCMIRWLTVHPKDRFEDSIHQITGFVADRFKIQSRGVLKEGYFADIVIFDKDGLKSHDLEENPLQYPEGIDYVLVNGVVTIDHKQHTGAKAGRMLRSFDK